MHFAVLRAQHHVLLACPSRPTPAATKADPTLPYKFFGYPATTAEWSTAFAGTLRNDVVSSNAPFKNLFSMPPANPKGYTHGEVLFHTRPGASPYVYDSML